MPNYVNRYREILNYTIPSLNVPHFKIGKRNSDIYIEYNEAERLDNLSYRAYGYPEFYWIILAANGYAAEFEIEPGEILRIPYPLEGAIEDIKGSLD